MEYFYPHTQSDTEVQVSKPFFQKYEGHAIPSAQRLVWAAKQPLGNAALGALFA